MGTDENGPATGVTSSLLNPTYFIFAEFRSVSGT
jgi:hypothetical protein